VNIEDNAMGLVVLGVLLLLARWYGLDPMAQWSVGWVFVPFLLALLWWWWSDVSGRTRRMADRKHQQRRDLRREKSLHAMGTHPSTTRRRAG
jgi:small Trp-rich protein